MIIRWDSSKLGYPPLTPPVIAVRFPGKAHPPPKELYLNFGYISNSVYGKFDQSIDPGSAFKWLT